MFVCFAGMIGVYPESHAEQMKTTFYTSLQHFRKMALLLPCSLSQHLLWAKIHQFLAGFPCLVFSGTTSFSNMQPQSRTKQNNVKEVIT
jgi:hypothetical protein